MPSETSRPDAKKASGRANRIAIVVVVVGLAVLALTAVVNQNAILELWYLHRLEKADADEALDLVETLGKIGSARCVPELVKRLGEPDGTTSTATQSLGMLCPRVARKTQAEIVDAMDRIHGLNPTFHLSASRVCECFGGA